MAGKKENRIPEERTLVDSELSKNLYLILMFIENGSYDVEQ